MSVASLPLAARENLLARTRREEPPGERRANHIRALGFVPLPDDCSTIVATAGRVTTARESRFPEWDAFAAETRASLAESDSPLSLWIPGLKLFSENTVQHGQSDGRAPAMTFVQVRHAAKVQALQALMNARHSVMLHRFTGIVRIAVFQVCDRSRIDPGNLYAKSLIDALLARGGGLGIIEDDSRRFVSFVGTGYRASTDGEVGVWIEIEAEEKAT